MNTQLHTKLKHILNYYLKSKSESLRSHPTADLVCRQVPSIIKELPFVSEEYNVVGSVGKGNWAFVPWIAVMNKRITNSTQRGYYIVYLFSEDMKSLYLSFAQGVTETSKIEMLRVKDEIRKVISIEKRFLKDDKIYLGESKLAKQYANSTAIYIKYEFDNLPNDVQLIRDLEYMITYYEQYIFYRNNTPVQVNEGDETNMANGNLSIETLVNNIHLYIKSKGFNYAYEDVANLFLSLKSKPFVIISGISGTGKTKIVQLFAESVGATEDNGQFKLIPVRPDWSDSSELLGYVDLKGDFTKGPLTEIIEHALDNPHLPHFVLLDEMNLARVEYYFSDVLSVMESRKRDGDEITSSTLLDEKYTGQAIRLPENLYIIGTVNMDETTHPFSKKVLDRANTIEFNEVYLNNFNYLDGNDEAVDSVRITNEQLKPTYISLKDIYSSHMYLVQKVSQNLEDINKKLKLINAHVGYRVRDEICFYMVHNHDSSLLDEKDAFDLCIMQKVLPRITGGDRRVESLLEQLYEQFTCVPFDDENVQESVDYRLSVIKIVDMLRRYRTDGFTSFWIS
ncbi:MrcB family domain-containing protein [Sporosarcina sp. UB5]|uniref:MrcB family domain-containing protein n=1 Tax=Sporosarcina sp. UB5 TaxID=3047463 RepID=UPI003D78BCCA